MKNSNPTQTNAWKELNTHFKQIQKKHLTTFFEDANRASDFTITWKDFLVDYSKHRVNKETRELLINLANEVDLKGAIDSYFGGEAINATEGRAVMHTALRDEGDNAFAKAEVTQTKQLIKEFTHRIISGDHKGATGKNDYRYSKYRNRWLGPWTCYDCRSTSIL